MEGGGKMRGGGLERRLIKVGAGEGERRGLLE